MELKQQKIIDDTAKIRHVDSLGNPYDELDDQIKNGYVMGYQQAILDICELMDIDVGDFIINLHKL